MFKRAARLSGGLLEAVVEIAFDVLCEAVF